MPDVIVRAREPHDTDDLHLIMNCPGVIRGTLQTPFRSLRWREEQYSQTPPDFYSLVAEVNGRVVGQLGLGVLSRPRRNHCGEFGMAVHDDFQGQGVGRALLAAMIDLADNWLGLRRIELEVFTGNAVAIHLYESFGFVIEGTLRDYAYCDGAFVDAHVMARLRR